MRKTLRADIAKQARQIVDCNGGLFAETSIRSEQEGTGKEAFVAIAVRNFPKLLWHGSECIWGTHTHGWRKKLVQNRQACPELNVIVPWLSFKTLEIAGGRTFLRKVATSCVSALVWDSFKR